MNEVISKVIQGSESPDDTRIEYAQGLNKEQLLSVLQHILSSKYFSVR